eukprot:3172393-Pyramimonas_sp.AAC.1
MPQVSRRCATWAVTGEQVICARRGVNAPRHSRASGLKLAAAPPLQAARVGGQPLRDRFQPTRDSRRDSSASLQAERTCSGGALGSRRRRS